MTRLCRKPILFVLLAFALCNSEAAFSREFCVDSVEGLHSALAAASANAEDDVVRIVQGMFVGNFVYASTEGKSLAIEGGWNAGCTGRVINPENSVLDGNEAGTVLVFVSSAGGDFSVDGLTVRNGVVAYSSGGGIYASGAHSVTLTNNIICANFAENAGGVYASGDAVTLTNNIIFANSVLGPGGGFAVWEAGSVTLTNNAIFGNSAGGDGGGVYASCDQVTLMNNTIFGNCANRDYSYGGGVAVWGNELRLINNAICGNSANRAFSHGGGVAASCGAMTLTNNTICGNSAKNGGGLRIRLYEETDRAQIYNNIIWNNVAQEGLDLWINNDGNQNDVPSPVDLFNNDFDQSESGTYVQIPFDIDPSNLLNQDPLFADPYNGNLHLISALSPCYNTGSNSAPELPETDADGNPRIMDGIVDMGAYECPETGAPIAAFSAEPTSGEAPLAVLFTDGSKGDVTSWEWDFGDGSALSSAQNPTHVYSDVGIYSVALTVSGPNGEDSLIKEDYISVAYAPPEAAFSADPTSGPGPLKVDFFDESVGIITDWAWDFGDGTTSSQQNPQHTYENPGQYTVRLGVEGPGGLDVETKPGYVRVEYPAPVCEFSASPLSGDAPLTVNFSDESTGEITEWSWDFGDGGTSTEQHPIHTFSKGGIYTITLAVVGPGGEDVVTKPDYIDVHHTAPVADFDAAPTHGNAPLSVSFNDRSSGEMTSWTWYFGDGHASSEQNPQHTYREDGVYTVTLTVKGPYGEDVEQKPDYVQVGFQAPVPDIKVNGSDGPVDIQAGQPAEVTVSLDSRSRAGQVCDWWVGAFAPFGTYWLNGALNWIHSDYPIGVGTFGLFDVDEVAVLNRSLPVGVYFLFFVIDQNANGRFDDRTFYDTIHVISEDGKTGEIESLINSK